MEEVLDAINNMNKDYGKMLFSIIADKKSEVKPILEESFSEIFEKCSVHMKTYFLRVLKQNGLESLIYDNFEYIVKSLKYDPILLKRVLKIINDKNFIRDNTDLIIEVAGKDCIFSISQTLKRIDGVDKDKLNAVFEANKEDVVKEILKGSVLGSTYYPGRWKNIKDEIYSYVPTVVIIIEELLKNENKRWIDIDVVGKGFYTTAFEIGDKVLKIGTSGKKFEAKNHRRILQPLLRTRIMENKRVLIEVEEKVKTERIPIEDLYKVYKEIRDDGLLITDFKEKNVGRLIKPNVVHFDGIESVASNAVGLDRELKKEEVLPAGELVVFDLDYIYKESDLKEGEEVAWPSRFAEKLEERYKREKAEEAEKAAEDIEDGHDF